MEHRHSRNRSEGESDATKRKDRSRSNSTSSSRPMLVPQESRKDIYVTPTPASSPAAHSTMLNMRGSHRGSVDRVTIDLESSSEADSAEFGSGVEEATRLLSMSTPKSSALSSSGGGIFGKVKRRLSTSARRKDSKSEETESMLTKAAISALSPQMINGEDYRIPTSIPELTIDSDEKLFTQRNIYFNLRRDLHAQLMVLHDLNNQQFEAQRKYTSAQFSDLRSKHTRTDALVSNISRGGVYVSSDSNKKIKELIKPIPEEAYAPDKHCKGGCFGCF